MTDFFFFFLSSNNNLMLEQNWSTTLESISYIVPLTPKSVKKRLISFKDSFWRPLPICSPQPSHFQSGNSGQEHTVQHSKFRAPIIHQSYCLCDTLLNCEYTVHPTGWGCVTFTGNLLAFVPAQSICASHSNWFSCFQQEKEELVIFSQWSTKILRQKISVHLL